FDELLERARKRVAEVSPARQGIPTSPAVPELHRTQFRGRPVEVPLRPDSGVEVDSAIARDRKSTRLNSSHVKTSYAGFCRKKKRDKENAPRARRTEGRERCGKSRERITSESTTTSLTSISQVIDKKRKKIRLENHIRVHHE